MDTEEIANALTHGAGLVLSLGGLVFLIVVTALHGNVINIVSCCVYGVTLVGLYAASTTYHTVVSPRWKRTFKIIDHCCIYLLIAGTYTPFTLVSLRGRWGWTLFGIIWGLALVGILFKLWFVNHLPIASTVVYVAMGWLVVIAFKPLLTVVSAPELAWLLIGGLFYTAGVIFFGWKKLRYSHAVWHVFVLAGSICHYVAVLYYLAPLKA
jgi:hemolysin III